MLLVLSAVTSLLAGCIVAAVAVGAGAGVGTYAYVNGKLTDDIPATPERVVAATNQAFADLHMAVISSASSAVDGKVIARTAEDKRIKVHVASSSSSTVSHISIRVGTWGDKDISIRVLEAIKGHLGLTAPSTAS
jgi:hypothetical protein